jgi:hypothetical protein
MLVNDEGLEYIVDVVAGQVVNMGEITVSIDPSLLELR